jgi:hypothetical protein
MSCILNYIHYVFFNRYKYYIYLWLLTYLIPKCLPVYLRKIFKNACLSTYLPTLQPTFLRKCLSTFGHTRLFNSLHFCIPRYIPISFFPGYLHACLFTCVTSYIPTCLTTNMLGWLSTSLNTCLCNWLHCCMFPCLPSYLATWLPVHLHNYINSYLPDYLFACQNVCLPPYIPVYFPA